MDNNIETTRRQINRAVAWTVPAIAVATAAPAFATSLRKDPGINGWVLVTTSDQDRNSYDLRFDSDEPGNGPDGAPYGLYIYDPNLNGQGQVIDSYSAAGITLWVRADRSNNPAQQISRTGTGWSNPVAQSVVTKADGLSYRGYKFNYSGAFTLNPDGRVYLTDLIVEMNNVNSADATYWVERTITINTEVKTFERRNGQRGPYGGASFRMAASNVRPA